MPAKVMVARIESGGSKIESDRKFCHCIFHVFTHSDAAHGLDGRADALCALFFPLIGAVIGAVEIATFALCEILGAELLFRNLPVDGGSTIDYWWNHMDGYLDVTDARHSYGERKKAGGFKRFHIRGRLAIIGLGLYLLLYAGAVSELVGADVWLLPGALMLERACSGYSVVAFPKAKKDGLAAEFSRSAETKVVRVSMAVLTVLAISWMIYWGHLRGALAALTALATFVCYYRFSMREFGGINGDLAGHFLQSCERNVVLVLAAMRLAGTCRGF